MTDSKAERKYYNWMAPISLSFAGPIADVFGVQSWYIVGGLTTFFLGIGAFFISPVVNIEEDRQKLNAVLTPTPVGGMAEATSD